MPIERTNLILSELSLVPKGANPLAKAPLFKADTTSNGGNMTEEVIKMSDEMDKKVKDYMKAKGCTRKEAEAALMKAFDKAEENETLRKALIDNGFVITKEGVHKKEPEEQLEVEGVMVNKSDIPAPVLKALEAAELQKQDVALTKMAEEKLGNMPVEKAKALLKTFEEDKEMMEFFAALDALLDGQFEEVGKSDENGDMRDPSEKLDEMAKAYATENKVSKEKGYAAVLKTVEGKALYKASLDKED